MHRFLHFGIHENAVATTQNALLLQLLGASHPDLPLGAQLPDRLRPPPTIHHDTSSHFENVPRHSPYLPNVTA